MCIWNKILLLLNMLLSWYYSNPFSFSLYQPSLLPSLTSKSKPKRALSKTIVNGQESKLEYLEQKAQSNITMINILQDGNKSETIFMHPKKLWILIKNILAKSGSKIAQDSFSQQLLFSPQIIRALRFKMNHLIMNKTLIQNSSMKMDIRVSLKWRKIL